MQSIDRGLLISGTLDLKNERAQKAYEALLTGRMREWSVGYAVLEGGEQSIEWEPGKTANLLTRLELLEVSLVSMGANRFTDTLQVRTIGAPKRKVGPADSARLAEFAEKTRDIPRPELVDLSRVVKGVNRIPLDARGKAELKAFNAKLDELAKAAIPRRRRGELTFDDILADVRREAQEHG